MTECLFHDGGAFHGRSYSHGDIETGEFLFWTTVSILFFAIGTSVNLGDLVDVSRRIQGLSVGVVFHYLFAPFLGLMWGSIFRSSDVSRSQSAALLIMACVPGSPQSVILTWRARGDVGLAILLFFATSFLDCFLWPGWSYSFATLLKGASTPEGDCYVTLPLLNILFGHMFLVFPLCFGLYARFIHHPSVYWMKKNSDKLTAVYFLIIWWTRFIEWNVPKVFNESGMSVLMCILFLSFNVAIVYGASRLLALTKKQNKALIFQLCLPSFILAYSSSRLTFRSEEASAPIVASLFLSLAFYAIAFYFQYESEDEDLGVKLPSPMLFDKHVGGLFPTMRHLNRFVIPIHDDFGTKGQEGISSSEDEEGSEYSASREAYDPSSATASLLDLETRGKSSQREEKFLSASQVKMDMAHHHPVVPMKKPPIIAAASDIDDLSSLASNSPRTQQQLELTPLKAKNITPRNDSPESIHSSSARRKRRRKKRAQKARKLVRNLSPASDSEEDSGGTGIQSTTSTDFTTIGGSDVTARMVDHKGRPISIVRQSKRKKKKKRRRRDMETFSTTSTLSQASAAHYQPHRKTGAGMTEYTGNRVVNANANIANPMHVPVYTSSYIDGDMMQNAYHHGEGMSFTSTQYSHRPPEPGAQMYYPNYTSNSVPSQNYIYYN